MFHFLHVHVCRFTTIVMVALPQLHLEVDGVVTHRLLQPWEVRYHAAVERSRTQLPTRVLTHSLVRLLATKRYVM